VPAVDPGGAGPESLGRAQVPRPLLVDHDRGRREALGQPAAAAAVVEVDVGDDDVGEVAGADAALIEGGDHPVETRLGARLDKGGTGARQEVARELVGLVLHQRVDGVDDIGARRPRWVGGPTRGGAWGWGPR